MNFIRLLIAITLCGLYSSSNTASDASKELALVYNTTRELSEPKFKEEVIKVQAQLQEAEQEGNSLTEELALIKYQEDPRVLDPNKRSPQELAAKRKELNERLAAAHAKIVKLIATFTAMALAQEHRTTASSSVTAASIEQAENNCKAICDKDERSFWGWLSGSEQPADALQRCKKAKDNVAAMQQTFIDQVTNDLDYLKYMKPKAYAQVLLSRSSIAASLPETKAR